MQESLIRLKENGLQLRTHVQNVNSGNSRINC